MTELPHLALEAERTLEVIPHPTVNGIAAEVIISGLLIRWQVCVLRDDEGWKLYLAHTTPDNGWSGLLREPDFAHLGHPTPTTLADLMAWCRWFFDVRRREGDPR